VGHGFGIFVHRIAESRLVRSNSANECC
jgi:hypothetical protein